VRLYRILLRRECKIQGVRRIRLSVGIGFGLHLPYGVSLQQFCMHFHHCHACFMPSPCSLPWLYPRNKMLAKRTNCSTPTAQISVTVSAHFRSNCCHKQHFSDTLCCFINMTYEASNQHSLASNILSPISILACLGRTCKYMNGN
jgi:hypothetical protein